MDAAALEKLARNCRWRRYPNGQRVISREAADSDVYLIIAGAVRVTSFSQSGRQVTFRDIPTGDWFGDFAAIDGLARSADIVALEDTLLAAMDAAEFRRLVHEHPAVCNQMLRRMVASVRELTERVFDLSTLGVQNRVHAELLRLARAAGVKANVARIDPAPKHTDIASQVSTYREQVTREISTMAKQGLVERAGNALLIPDVARLVRIVADVRRSP
ncbi:MAG: transcriptional regulator, Crp/Fnr family [Betaproteobacteria bacterium]|nr:transcriptional regulator, Crp/Fnr family [Betaproteobacteria bacterium]